MTRRPTYRERDLQVAVANMLALHERAGHCVYLHVPNEGKRSWFAGRELKLQGMRPGAPDFIVWRQSVFCIELKTTRGTMTPAQQNFAEKIHSINHRYYTVKAATPDDAVRQVCELCGLDPDYVARAA